MAVTFQLPPDPPLGLVAFAWSPLFESLLSLRVVTRPKHAPLHLPWVRRCRDLPADLRAEIDALVGSMGQFVPGLFEVGLLGHSPEFHDEVAALRELPLDLVAYEMSLALGGLECGHTIEEPRELIHDAAYRDRVLAAAPTPQGRAVLEQVFADPAAVRERLAVMLERYWDAAFADEWERLRPRIEADVTDGARTLITRGIAGLVDEMLPEGAWHPDEAVIVVEKRFDDHCDVAARGGMLFVPTVYGWPRVLIELAEPWPVAIIFPLRELRSPEVPLAADHEVAEGLRALGDETRLQITRLVAEQPRSTKELAELLSLSDSAISRHLKILAGAGLVTGRRDGYYVLYGLRPERIGELGGALRHTLGLAQTAPADLPALPVSISRVAER